MKQRSSRETKQPADLPSIPDLGSAPDQHDEPETPRKPDRAPAGNLQVGGRPSLAELRLQVEILLSRREAPDVDAWSKLGEDARTLLIKMLDEVMMAENRGLKQRIIATVGQLGVKRAIPGLSEVLLNESEDAITRAAAANALGRIGGETVILHLANAIRDQEGVVRRQVGLALGRVGGPAVIGHLQALAADRSAAVSEVAEEALRSLQQQSGANLGIKGNPQTRKTPKRRLQPKDDR